MAGRWTKRFWTSTRGRIIALLRRGSQTVNDLAEALGLTDNAVRAQLTALERDGLVHPSGTRPGTRKPNTTYDLTPEAGQLFHRADAVFFPLLLDVLAEGLPAAERDEILRAVGQRAAAKYPPAGRGAPLEERLRQALAVLQDLGGLAEVQRQDGRLFLRGFGCPLALVVADHPELCRMM